MSEAIGPCSPMQAYFVPDTAVGHQSSLNRCSAHLNAAAPAPGYVDRCFVHVRATLTKGEKEKKFPGHAEKVRQRRPKRRSDAPVLHAAGRRLAWRHEPAASGGRRGHRTTHAAAAAASRLRLESHREMGAAVDTTHTPINRSEAIARDSVSFPEPSLSGGD